ncbi:MAG: VanZ family protein [Hydrogenophilales bacterium]|nr:VanZ family protein [Hydrogenophilales bacterium]
MHSPAEKTHDYPRASRALLLWLALGYLTFAVYGSLVPLDFHGRPLAEAWLAFRDIRYLNLSIGSRADWVANILLFIPLAFLWSGVLWPARGVIRRALVVLGVFVACMGLSLAIEFTQLFFPPRTVSLNDILAESIGAAAGVMAWLAFGSRLMAWLAGWRSAHSPLDVWGRVLYLYLFVLFAYNVLPLDLTLSPVEIFHKWREGRVVLAPFSFVFANPIEEVYGLLTDILIWMPVAFLWRFARPASRLKPLLAVVLIASLLEFLQLFVYSRVSDVTDIFTAALGAGVGAWLSGRWAGPAQEGGASHSRAWLWLGFALLWIGVLAAIFWYPFDFHTGRAFLAERLQSLHKVPFEAYYYGTEYRAVTEVLHKTGFFLPLGLLLALGVAQIRHYSWRQIADWGALIAIGLAAFGIEAGQLFMPGKNADITDWVLETMGGVAGYAGARLLGARLRNHQNSNKKIGHAWKANAGLTAAQDSLRVNRPAAVRDSDHA